MFCSHVQCSLRTFILYGCVFLVQYPPLWIEQSVKHSFQLFSEHIYSLLYLKTLKFDSAYITVEYESAHKRTYLLILSICVRCSLTCNSQLGCLTAGAYMLFSLHLPNGALR